MASEHKLIDKNTINPRLTAKVLIEAATNTERVDRIIDDYAGSMTLKEKIAFLKGMFGVEIIDQKTEESDEQIYEIMLHAIWAETQ